MGLLDIILIVLVIAWLVERLVRNEKVRGSTPLSSTKAFLRHPCFCCTKLPPAFIFFSG